MTVALLVPVGGLEVKRQDVKYGHIGALQIVHALLPLLREQADHVAGKDQKAAPRNQREQGVEVESGGTSQTLHRLEEDHENHHEDGRKNGRRSADVEAGEDDGEVVEAQERDFVVDQPVDAQ